MSNETSPSVGNPLKRESSRSAPVTPTTSPRAVEEAEEAKFVSVLEELSNARNDICRKSPHIWVPTRIDVV